MGKVEAAIILVIGSVRLSEAGGIFPIHGVVTDMGTRHLVSIVVGYILDRDIALGQSSDTKRGFLCLSCDQNGRNARSGDRL